jgi:hypothetical protein
VLLGDLRPQARRAFDRSGRRSTIRKRNQSGRLARKSGLLIPLNSCFILSIPSPILRPVPRFDQSRTDFAPHGFSCVRWTASRVPRSDRHKEIEFHWLERGCLVGSKREQP